MAKHIFGTTVTREGEGSGSLDLVRLWAGEGNPAVYQISVSTPEGQAAFVRVSKATLASLIAAAVVSLAGCITVPERVTVEWKAGTQEETDRACARIEGAHAIVIGHYRGCSLFYREAGFCRIWAPDITDVREREKMATLGHELVHCYKGVWH